MSLLLRKTAGIFKVLLIVVFVFIGVYRATAGILILGQAGLLKFTYLVPFALISIAVFALFKRGIPRWLRLLLLLVSLTLLSPIIYLLFASVLTLILMR